MDKHAMVAFVATFNLFIEFVLLTDAQGTDRRNGVDKREASDCAQLAPLGILRFLPNFHRLRVYTSWIFNVLTTTV
jgi:hypothetical protein